MEDKNRTLTLSAALGHGQPYWKLVRYDASSEEDARALLEMMPATDHATYLEFVRDWKQVERDFVTLNRSHKSQHGYKDHMVSICAHNAYQLRRVAKVWAARQYQLRMSGRNNSIVATTGAEG